MKQVKTIKGFGILNVLVVAGMLSGLALAALQQVDNINFASRNMDNHVGHTEMLLEMRQILENKDWCRLSIAGPGPEGFPIGPVRFFKEDHDRFNSRGHLDETEGFPIQLYFGDQAGINRTIKRFSGTDPNYQKFGNLKLVELKISFPNPTGTAEPNYSPQAFHTDIAYIHGKYEKMVRKDMIEIKKFNLKLNVGLKTDSSRETTILSCSQSTGFLKECRICFSETEGSSQCQGSRNSCTNWVSAGQPLNYTNPFRDDTDNRSGGCTYQWGIQCR